MYSINTSAGFFSFIVAFCFGAAATGLLSLAAAFPGAGKSVPVYFLYSAFKSKRTLTAASTSS